MAADPRRLAWDERHSGGDFEGDGPNPTLVSAVTGLAPGRALELAAGSGTNAVWLAQQGWRTTAVDWSPVGLANGKAKADAAGVTVEWLERDLFAWSPQARTHDLVAIAYLHVPAVERGPIYAAAVSLVPGQSTRVGGHAQPLSTGRPVIVHWPVPPLTETVPSNPRPSRYSVAERLR